MSKQHLKLRRDVRDAMQAARSVDAYDTAVDIAKRMGLDICPMCLRYPTWGYALVTYMQATFDICKFCAIEGCIPERPAHGPERDAPFWPKGYPAFWVARNIGRMRCNAISVDFNAQQSNRIKLLYSAGGFAMTATEDVYIEQGNFDVVADSNSLCLWAKTALTLRVHPLGQSYLAMRGVNCSGVVYLNPLVTT